MQVFDLTKHIAQYAYNWSDWQDWMHDLCAGNDNSNVVTLWTT